MARIKLSLPEQYAFSTELEISIGLINYGAHLGNDSALTLLHEARMRFLQSLGFSEKDVGGCGLVVADAVLVYKSQAYWGERLQVDVATEDFNTYGCDLFYRVHRGGEGRDVLHAKTGIVFFDYAANKPVNTPEAFLRAVGRAV